MAIERDSRCELSIAPNQPLVVYGNHPAWWDPLIAHFVNWTLFPKRQFYAPIDADALENYKVFGKLGFYGVRLHTTGGAAAFLRQSQAILNAADTAIWMTPEGRFSDVRDRSARFMPGLSHLCSRMDTGYVLPLALEYVFWEERLPVCLIAMGKPQEIDRHGDLTKNQWNERLESELRDTQEHLMELAVARTSQPFDNLLHGKVGAGATYDMFRRLRAWGRGQTPNIRHGDQFE